MNIKIDIPALEKFANDLSEQMGLHFVDINEEVIGWHNLLHVQKKDMWFYRMVKINGNAIDCVHLIMKYASALRSHILAYLRALIFQNLGISEQDYYIEMHLLSTSDIDERLMRGNIRLHVVWQLDWVKGNALTLYHEKDAIKVRYTFSTDFFSSRVLEGEISSLDEIDWDKAPADANKYALLYCKNLDLEIGALVISVFRKDDNSLYAMFNINHEHLCKVGKVGGFDNGNRYFQIKRIIARKYVDKQAFEFQHDMLNNAFNNVKRQIFHAFWGKIEDDCDAFSDVLKQTIFRDISIADIMQITQHMRTLIYAMHLNAANNQNIVLPGYLPAITLTFEKLPFKPLHAYPVPPKVLDVQIRKYRDDKVTVTIHVPFYYLRAHIKTPDEDSKKYSNLYQVKFNKKRFARLLGEDSQLYQFLYRLQCSDACAQFMSFMDGVYIESCNGIILNYNDECRKILAELRKINRDTPFYKAPFTQRITSFSSMEQIVTAMRYSVGDVPIYCEKCGDVLD